MRHMQDLDKALADIVAIRSQIARDTAFRGLGRCDGCRHRRPRPGLRRRSGSLAR